MGCKGPRPPRNHMGIRFDDPLTEVHDELANVLGTCHGTQRPMCGTERVADHRKGRHLSTSKGGGKCQHAGTQHRRGKEVDCQQVVGEVGSLLGNTLGAPDVALGQLHHASPSGEQRKGCCYKPYARLLLWLLNHPYAFAHSSHTVASEGVEGASGEGPPGKHNVCRKRNAPRVAHSAHALCTQQASFFRRACGAHRIGITRVGYLQRCQSHPASGGVQQHGLPTTNQRQAVECHVGSEAHSWKGSRVSRVHTRGHRCKRACIAFQHHAASQAALGKPKDHVSRCRAPVRGGEDAGSNIAAWLACIAGVGSLGVEGFIAGN